jgi:Carboxypeptidase regulatory-like domain/TonB dependent receptor
MKGQPFLAAVAVAGLALGLAAAVSASPSAVRIRVLDPSGAVVPRATLALHCADGPVRRAVTGANGEARFPWVDPGSCALEVNARGFEPLAPSETSPDATGVLTIVLAVARREESVNVGDATRDALRRERSFSQVLTPEEIASLPDDPEEMEDALRQRAGPGATLRVNGFTGGRLPPKSQIRQIRIQTNRFAAENHEGGHPGIDIVTRPGLGSWRTSVGGGVRDRAWGGRPPLAAASGAQSAHRLSLTVDGPLQEDKTSLSLQLQSREASDATAVTALFPGAPSTVRPTTDKLDLQARLEHAWGKTQTTRAEIQHNTYDRALLGAGGLALPERGYADDRGEDLFRLSNTGVVLGVWASDSRFQIRHAGVAWTPRTTGAAVDVLGAFSAGGSPLSGSRATWEAELGQDLARSLGRHSLRGGFLYQSAAVRSDERDNAAGTFTFASLADWQAGRALLFTQRTGDPHAEVALHRVGFYAQDSWRPADAVSVDAGARYEAQTFVGAGHNLAPRFGVTWALRRGWTLRASGGRFFDWLDADTVAQVRAGEGGRTRDLSFENPTWPDPSSSGAEAAATERRWALGPGLRQPRVDRLSFGVERSVGSQLRLNAEYGLERGASALRARNFEDGAGRLFEVRTEGRARAQSLRVDARLADPGRRASLLLGYILHRGRNDADGPFAFPADDSNLAAEWGPAGDDIRHRVFGFGQWRIAGGLHASSQFFAQSGAPWDAITGRDDNGDTLANDRPSGTTRNARRGGWTMDASVRIAWDFGFGGRRQTGPRGPQVVAIRLGGDDGPPDIGGGADDQRYGVQLYALVTNAFDHLDPMRYGNVIGSPLFAQAVEAGPGRRVEIGTRFRF